MADKEDPCKDLNFKLFLSALMLMITLWILFSLYVYGCGIKPKKSENPPPGPVKCDYDLQPGETKDFSCTNGNDLGKRVLVCTEQGTKEAFNSCGDCGKVGFDQVAPILTESCVSCHVTPGKIDEYPQAKAWAVEMKRRINLDVNSREHMPLNTAPQLDPDKLRLLNRWLDEGAVDVPDCTPSDDTGFIDLDKIETAILDDLGRLDSEDREQTRYLISAHLPVPGAIEGAINKELNSINPSLQDIVKVVPVDVGKSVWRFDQRSFDIDLIKSHAIEQGDRINIVSNTTKGQIIRALTKTNKPWFHADAFMDNVQTAAVYYELLEIPPKEVDFLKRINVNFAKSLRQFDALFVGGNQSVISLLKNRLLVRVVGFPSQGSYYWQSFDTDDQFVDTKNLFEFPLLKDLGGVDNFNFDASEVIYSLPNGMQGYALFDNKGNRQNAAPQNVVRDTESPISSEIKNAGSCTRCHSSGLIPMQDQILSHVTANAAQFISTDVQIVQKVYKRQNAINAAFIADQKFFGKAMEKLGLNLTDRDPITQATDRLLLDWGLEQAAAFLFLTKEDFIDALNTSATAKAQIGQLLTGGTVTFQQFITVLPQLIIDARLFENKLGE